MFGTCHNGSDAWRREGKRDEIRERVMDYRTEKLELEHGYIPTLEKLRTSSSSRNGMPEDFFESDANMTQGLMGQLSRG